MIHWTAETDTPTPNSMPNQIPMPADGTAEAKETNQPARQPRCIDEYELYGFHNFTVLDDLIKQNM